VEAIFDHELSGIRNLASQVHLVQDNVLARTNSTIHITFSLAGR
jgi:hypothetical protein